MSQDFAFLYPIATAVFLGFLSIFMRELGSYLAEKKSMSRLSRVAMAVSTAAGEGQRQLMLTPALSPGEIAVKQQKAINDGEKYVSSRLADTFAKLSAKDREMLEFTLKTMIGGALGHLMVASGVTPQAAIAPPIQADAAVSMHEPDLEPLPPSPLTVAVAVAPTELPYGPKADAT